MSLATVRNKIDTWLTARWPTLVGWQNSYFGTNGKYFQGKWTHTNTIEQTDALAGDALADLLDDKPTDQPQSWRDLVGTALNALPFPARLRIDVYDGPEGKGWAATLQVLYQGAVYERSQNVGPETWRTVAWHSVTLS